MVQPNRSQMKMRRMRFACWIPMDINTHTEHAVFIDIPKQQLLRVISPYYVTLSLHLLFPLNSPCISVSPVRITRPIRLFLLRTAQIPGPLQSVLLVKRYISCFLHCNM